jgi:glutamate/tyrosine decarboxylase-like PLP-dependent enzyme
MEGTGLEQEAALLETDSLDILRAAADKLERGFDGLLKGQGDRTDLGAIENVLLEVADRLRDNYPYFHPLYAGQMLKPPHPIARLAYSLALWINPNNHALDGGRASSAMEKEAVAEIAGMFGWERHLGHLCGGGTMAILASDQAHYTHRRISSVLGLDFESIPCDRNGRMDASALRDRLTRGDVGTVVATIGTTATGSVDPLPEILALREQYGFRIHADAAYGGYFGLAANLSDKSSEAYARLGEVDSIVIDPHKHGLQPYGCGCVLFRDPSVGRFYKHDSPYTYFTSADLHLGEISLECSRPGAAAVALWATQRMFPLVEKGVFPQMLRDCREAALSLHSRLVADTRFMTAFEPELDIVVWAPRAGSVSEASQLSRKVFKACAKRDLHLALAELPTAFFDAELHGLEPDRDTLTCLRSVLMKPEHKEWIGPIWTILDVSTNEALGAGSA